MTNPLVQKARSRRIAVLERLGFQDMPDISNIFSLETARQSRQFVMTLPFISCRGTNNSLNFEGKGIAA